MTSPTETREAVARTVPDAPDAPPYVLTPKTWGSGWRTGYRAALASVAAHLAPRDAEIQSLRARVEAAEAALAESERQGAPTLADHRVLTLHRMLDRADRMQRCLYRAGCNIDGAIYREEVDALKAVFAALTLKEPTHEH